MKDENYRLLFLVLDSVGHRKKIEIVLKNIDFCMRSLCEAHSDGSYYLLLIGYSYYLIWEAEHAGCQPLVHWLPSHYRRETSVLDADLKQDELYWSLLHFAYKPFYICGRFQCSACMHLHVNNLCFSMHFQGIVCSNLNGLIAFISPFVLVLWSRCQILVRYYQVCCMDTRTCMDAWTTHGKF